MTKADNDIDAALMLLAPLNGARQAFETEDGFSRRIAVQLDDTTQQILVAIGEALVAVKSKCCTNCMTIAASPSQDQVPLDLPP